MPDPFSSALSLSGLQTGLRILDIVGTVAFAMSGALLGVRKRFDLFGVLVLGCVTAVGGGAIRDTLTGNTPPLFLRDETYLWLAILGSLLAFALGRRMAYFERAIRVFDTLGLALFAATGAIGALRLGLGPLGVTFAGTLSGVGGGIVRDLLAHEVPEVLYRRDQLYATAAAAGALTVYLLNGRMSSLSQELCGAGVVVLARIVSRRGWVKLPVRRV
ncbi:trimeric intracellular cation channel family protein [Deinococcus sp.]|uniref:trimeric intracellular cation channel family protein n=1 Tax=Deinococcus sp. TaxID=47478 RepID=UPI003CC69F5C